MLRPARTAVVLVRGLFWAPWETGGGLAFCSCVLFAVIRVAEGGTWPVPWPVPKHARAVPDGPVTGSVAGAGRVRSQLQSGPRWAGLGSVWPVSMPLTCK